MIHRRKMVPMSAMANTSRHDSPATVSHHPRRREGDRSNVQIFFCCKKARTTSVWPWGFRLKTSISQTLEMDPDGPNSSMDTMISPVSHSTNSMKAPIMTIAGKRRRWAMSQKSPPIKTIESAVTVMK
jgi:hypothetical protein